uniref:Uncharacterized protein n=1 Tax=Panagrolaimus sp. JU765 TaxID=591449 RepID=A0AC34QVJ3_9BILA
MAEEDKQKKESPTDVKKPKNKSDGREKKKKDSKKSKGKNSLVKTGVEVSALIFTRCGKDRKICVNKSSKDFIEHLEAPVPGSLTGGQLPYTAVTTMRIHRIAKMDQVMACGPSKDVVLHRGMPLGKTLRQTTVPYALDIVVLLSIPAAPQMLSQDREILILLQNIARHHYSAFANDFSYIVDDMTRLAEILREKKQTLLRTQVLTAIMSKKPLTAKIQKEVFDQLGGGVEIDKEQINSTITTLRNRDQLSRDQADRIKDQMTRAIHERRNGRIRAMELIRKVLKCKNV